MNSLRNQRRFRKTLPALEDLDQRITPSAIPAAAVLAAELRVESRQVGRWEAALAHSHTAAREQILMNHIERTEGRMAKQEARLARIEARAMARMHASNLARAAAASMAQQPSVNRLGFSSIVSRRREPRTRSSSRPITLPVMGTIGSTSPTPSESGGTTDSGSPATLPDNVSRTLSVIYDAFVQDGSNFPANLPVTDAANKVVIEGSNVGIQVHDNNPADFNTLVSELQSAGMQITASSAQNGLVVGMLPIAQLPTVGALPGAPSITPQFQPMVL